MKRAAAAIALASLLAAHTAEAAPRRKIADVCEGCFASVPDDAEPAPLLVTLHGDWGYMAPDLHKAWERFAAPRGVALLSLACPAKLGCKNSWWQWNGEPSWIVEQIDRLAKARAIDRDRMWIVGWSGGASYLGMRTQELERTFAGIVVHGGGVWPWPDDCPAEKPLVIFLVGNRNPLHANGLRLRDHYARCGNEITMHLLQGADHDGEWKALDAKGGAILDALASARKTHAPAMAGTPTSETAVANVPTQTGPATESAPARAVAIQAPPRAGCGCRTTTASRSGESFACGVVAVALFVITRSRRARRGACPPRASRCRDRERACRSRSGREPGSRPA